MAMAAPAAPKVDAGNIGTDKAPKELSTGEAGRLGSAYARMTSVEVFKELKKEITDVLGKANDVENAGDRALIERANHLNIAFFRDANSFARKLSEDQRREVRKMQDQLNAAFDKKAAELKLKVSIKEPPVMKDSHIDDLLGLEDKKLEKTISKMYKDFGKFLDKTYGIPKDKFLQDYDAFQERMLALSKAIREEKIEEAGLATGERPAHQIELPSAKEKGPESSFDEAGETPGKAKPGGKAPKKQGDGKEVQYESGEAGPGSIWSVMDEADSQGKK